MNAWPWIANPRKWNSTPDFTALECLRRYLERGNVYWATPLLSEVADGDMACIWRTESEIVAVGKVAEAPRFYSGDNKQEFRFPDRLEVPGWNESEATSPWKTGISLDDHFWQEPLVIHFRPGFLRGKTLVRLTDGQQRIVSAVRARRSP